MLHLWKSILMSKVVAKFGICSLKITSRKICCPSLFAVRSRLLIGLLVLSCVCPEAFVNALVTVLVLVETWCYLLTWSHHWS